NEHNFVVEKQLRMHYSVQTVRFTLIATFARGLFVSSFLVANCIVRWLVPVGDIITAEIWLDGVYIVPWFAVVLPALIYWRQAAASVKVNVVDVCRERELHFEHLRKQWNNE
ncbi:hypothetical protein AAVH_39833, partial [Aphelenchoides avenae]